MPRIKVESLSTADEDEDGYVSHSDSTLSDTDEEDEGITLSLQAGQPHV